MLIQHAQGQAKKSLQPLLAAPKVAIENTTFLRNKYVTVTSKSFSRPRKKKSALLKNSNIVLKVKNAITPNTLQIQVALPDTQPFVVYLNDQDQQVYFRQHYVNTSQVNILSSL